MLPDLNVVVPTSRHTYIQSSRYNALDGGVRRTFPPLPGGLPNDPFLHDLIRFFYACAGFAPTLEGSPFQVGVHLIRQVPHAEAPAFSHPLHKDGEWVTYSMLVARQNVEGGKGMVADNGRRLVWEGTQKAFGDTFGVVDEKVYHAVSPVRRLDPVRPAWRDVLLVDFTPLVPMIPGEA
jgi:hypothetical protein